MKRSISMLAILALAASSFAGSEEPPPTPADVSAPPAEAEVFSSGLASKQLTPGRGERRPGPLDHVIVHYTGWTTDGEMFDSSVARGKPARLPLDRVIPGWAEGLQLMVEGEKRRLWIPGELAYAGQEDLPQGMLVFDVELIKIVPIPPVPEDVTEPPTSLQPTKSGLYSKVLERGHGTEHPKKKSTVTVHYTGWTTDGKMFDSSVMREEPASFSLRQVIAGWTEGVQLMVEGEKRRLWIPEKLAYKGQEGAPQGMLVFDIELLSID